MIFSMRKYENKSYANTSQSSARAYNADTTNPYREAGSEKERMYRDDLDHLSGRPSAADYTPKDYRQ